MEKSAEGVSRGMMEKRGERAKTLIESCEIKGRRGESGRRVCVRVCVGFRQRDSEKFAPLRNTQRGEME